MTRPSVLLLLLACGPRNEDLDRDGFSVDEGDCDDADSSRHPDRPERIGDGVDENCDGTDRVPLPLVSWATGYVWNDIEGHTLGYFVTCGGDVDGNGVGDLGFTAENFAWAARIGETTRAVYRTNGPLVGAVHESDIEGWKIGQGPLIGLHFGYPFVLLGDPYPRGLLFSASSNPEWNRSENGTQFLRFAQQPAADVTEVPNGFFSQRDLRSLAALAVPDLTGDGAPDLVIAGPSLAIVEGPPTGYVEIGQVTRTSMTHGPDVQFAGPGGRLASGDFNGDGAEDLVFLSSIWELWAEQIESPDVTVELGPFAPGERLVGDPTRSLSIFGTAREGGIEGVELAAGDLDGDGIDDLAISTHTGGEGNHASERQGEVWVFFGPLEPGSVDILDADVILEGEVPGAWLGSGLAIGDLDGDGIDELAIGAALDGFYNPGAPPGLVYVMRSPLELDARIPDDVAYVFQGGGRGDSAGWKLAACDLDGDGADSLVIGAMSHNEFDDIELTGRVYHLELPR